MYKDRVPQSRPSYYHAFYANSEYLSSSQKFKLQTGMRSISINLHNPRYEDWKCAECCQGDRCNYYVTVRYTGCSNHRHPQGLGRIIRRQEFASEFGYFLKSNTSPRSWFGTLKVLEKFKFAISRFINLLQSSNFGLFPFLNGSIRSAKEK